MALTAWRLVKSRYTATAFTGKGAADYGGRWNSKGMPVVYCSSSLALATLEILVHLQTTERINYAFFKLTFDEKLVYHLPQKDLPSDWRLQPSTGTTQHFGDTWLREAKTPIMAVPSVVVPTEINYLLNPWHPDFRKITISKPDAYTLDSRLYGEQIGATV